jgi:hypothetical protein
MIINTFHRMFLLIRIHPFHSFHKNLDNYMNINYFLNHIHILIHIQLLQNYMQEGIQFINI